MHANEHKMTHLIARPEFLTPNNANRLPLFPVGSGVPPVEVERGGAVDGQALVGVGQLLVKGLDVGPFVPVCKK